MQLGIVSGEDLLERSQIAKRDVQQSETLSFLRVQELVTRSRREVEAEASKLQRTWLFGDKLRWVAAKREVLDAGTGGDELR